MDPDIPQPSIETDTLPDDPPLPSYTGRALHVNTTAAATPLPASSPRKSPYGKPRSPAPSSSPHKVTRSPSVASSYSDKQSTPTLHSKRSTSNLNAARATTPSRTQFRRASSNLNPSSPVASFKSAMSMQEPPQRKILTPSIVAKDYFKKDLDLHQDAHPTVAVIVHDSCYGHRFSRPRSSKAALNSIVERPERIHATLLGASTAYVRLGGRHDNGRHPPHPDRKATSQSVPFEIRKTSRYIPLNHPSVTHIHGSKWMEELQIMCDSAEGKLALNGKELVRPIGYGKDEHGISLPKLHEGDLYLSSETLSALQGCLGGVCDAVDLVYGSSSTERAFVCIRPPGHHCSSNVPSGFCWLNNVHVGITYGAITHGLTHAAIIDIDLHHGDGSQSIAWDHNHKAQTMTKKDASHKKTPIGYYSIHDINSFPCEDGDPDKIRNASVCLENAHGQSIWNVHFEHWKNLTEFWKLYQSQYVVLLEKARKFLRHHSTRFRQAGVQPKAAIFISAGFDASEWEMPGMQRHGVNVPTEFYAKITADIVKMSKEEDLGADGRIISVLEGGYSDRALTSGVLSHLCGLVDEPSKNIEINHTGGLASSAAAPSSGPGLALSEHTIDRYDPSWWATHELETLEAIVLGNLPPPPKASKDKPAGNYSSPTQASTNRMTYTAQERRSLSAQFEARLALENEAPPPPPDVDWAIASYELSRLLIPTDRQTLSCRHEELNAEVTRARKERQSVLVLPGPESMQLRERRSKPPPMPSAAVRSSSRSSTRRTTIASVNDLPDPSLGNGTGVVVPNGRLRRGSSASSSIISGFQEMKIDDAVEKTARPSEVPDTNSTAPTRTTKPPVTKKPKAVTTTRGPAKPRNSPRKATASSRPGSSSSGKTNASRVPSDPLSINSRAAPPSRQQSADTGSADGMDNLTNGMKKVSIKLKMPAAEEQAAKQKKIEEETKPTAPTKPARKIPAARTVKPKPVGRTGTLPVAQPQVQPGPKLDTPTAFQPVPSTNDTPPAAFIQAPDMLSSSTTTIAPKADSSPIKAPVDLPLTSNTAPVASEPDFAMPTPEPQVSTRSEAPASAEDPSNNKGNAVPEVISNLSGNGTMPATSVPVKTEPTNKTEPTQPATRPASNGNIFARPLTPNKRTRDDLPKFTSSSPIPFSKPGSRPPSSAGKLAEGQKQEERREVGGEKEGSIWDIPETPQTQR